MFDVGFGGTGVALFLFRFTFPDHRRHFDFAPHDRTFRPVGLLKSFEKF